MRFTGVVLVMGIIGLAVPVAGAEPYDVGDVVQPFSLDTQHGTAVEVGVATQLVLVTHDMDAGKIARAVLEEHTEATLAERGAVYVADISRMPGFVSRLIAIPRMRRRPYPVLLDREGVTAGLFAHEEGKVTVVRLEAGRVTDITLVDSESAVREALAVATPTDAVPDGSDARLPAMLRDVHGERVSVRELATDHHLAFVTLKASWCPVCRAQLARLGESLPRLRGCNATFIVLAPGPRDDLRAVADASGFPFPFVADDGLQIARSLDLVLGPGEIVPAIFTVDDMLGVDWIQRGRSGAQFGDEALMERLRCPPMQQASVR